MSTRTTLAQQAAITRGQSSGFHYQRHILAVLVLTYHIALTSYGVAVDKSIWDSAFGPFIKEILPLFFALSGYLVAGSLERVKDPVPFLALRGLRIFPALTVEVVLCAFILGPIATVYSLKHYFGAAEFFDYLMNPTGWIHYELPGVFLNNPYSRIVNQQLWTVPYELLCYILLAALANVGIMKHRALAPVMAIALSVLYFLDTLARHHWHYPRTYGNMSGVLLSVCFLWGISIYLYADRLPWNLKYATVAVVATTCLLGFVRFGEFLAPPLVAYVTVAFGLTDYKKLGFMKTDDYSYGIFLYGFPIQQAFCYFFPALRAWYWNLLICLPLAIGFAILSWHVVEKPMLGLKKYIIKKPARTAVPENISATST